MPGAGTAVPKPSTSLPAEAVGRRGAHSAAKSSGSLSTAPSFKTAANCARKRVAKVEDMASPTKAAKVEVPEMPRLPVPKLVKPAKVESPLPPPMVFEGPPIMAEPVQSAAAELEEPDQPEVAAPVTTAEDCMACNFRV